MDPTTIIRAYTSGAGKADSGPLAEPVTLLHSKYIPGDQPAVVAPLWYALLERHASDLHFAAYSSAEEVRCLKANAAGYTLRFPVAVFDLDFAGHAARPGIADFADLVRLLWVIDHTPNVVYPTRGGARIVYCIEPITDPVEYEDRLRTLLDTIRDQTPHSPYQIDAACKDWTRLFRAPRVVRDGVAKYDVAVRQYHDDLLDLRRFEKKARHQRKVTLDGTAMYTGADPWIGAKLRAMAEGNRNNTVYALLRYVRDKYTPQAQEVWVGAIANKAIAEGMDEREFWRTHQSAFQY